MFCTEVASTTARALDSPVDGVREPLEREGSPQIGEVERTPEVPRRRDPCGEGISAAILSRRFLTAACSASDGVTSKGLRLLSGLALVALARLSRAEEMRSNNSEVSTDEAKGNTEPGDPAQRSTRADESTLLACDSACFAIQLGSIAVGTLSEDPHAQRKVPEARGQLLPRCTS